MNKLIICTTGTSITNSCKSQREQFGKRNRWEEEIPQITGELKIVVDDWLQNSGQKAKSICAEYNTLNKIGIDPSDKIILLASDTAHGRISAEAIHKVLIKTYGLNAYQVEIKRIEGLQIHDAKKLREEGLSNLVKVVLGILTDPQLRYSYDIILNPTGGYKGIVPFLTILGMLYSKKTVYMFEHANELITLPPLPFSFDMEIYQRVRPALAYIDEQVAVPEQAYLSKVTNYTEHEKDLFLSFIEQYDEQLVTLSPLAYCLLAIEDAQKHPYLSEEAMKQLEAASDASTLAIKRMLSNVTNPLWRNRHIKTWPTSDLLVIKQSRTSARIVGLIRNDDFYVTHIFDNHDDYERGGIAGQYVKDFDEVQFELWTEVEKDSVDEENVDKLVQARDELFLENKELQASMDHQLADIEANKKVLEEKDMRILSLEDEMKEHKASIEALEHELRDQKALEEALVHEIEAVKREHTHKCEDFEGLANELEQLKTGFTGRLIRLFGKG